MVKVSWYLKVLYSTPCCPCTNIPCSNIIVLQEPKINPRNTLSSWYILYPSGTKGHGVYSPWIHKVCWFWQTTWHPCGCSSFLQEHILANTSYCFIRAGENTPSFPNSMIMCNTQNPEHIIVTFTEEYINKVNNLLMNGVYFHFFGPFLHLIYRGSSLPSIISKLKRIPVNPQQMVWYSLPKMCGFCYKKSNQGI